MDLQFYKLGQALHAPQEPKPSSRSNQLAMDGVDHGFKPIVSPKLLVNVVQMVAQGWQGDPQLPCDPFRLLALGELPRGAHLLLRLRPNWYGPSTVTSSID